MKKFQLLIMIMALGWGWNGCASKTDDHQAIQEEVSKEKTFTNPSERAKKTNAFTGNRR